MYSGKSRFVLIFVSYFYWSFLFMFFQQCGGHGKEVDYSWTRQAAMKQGYEVKKTMFFNIYYFYFYSLFMLQYYMLFIHNIVYQV